MFIGTASFSSHEQYAGSFLFAVLCVLFKGQLYARFLPFETGGFAWLGIFDV